MFDNNKEGCLSKLPIVKNDRVGIIIAVNEQDILVPAAPIIWGTYKGYRKYEVDKNLNTQIVGEICNTNIDNLLVDLDELTYKDANFKVIEKIDFFLKARKNNPWIEFDSSKIFLLIEHESILKDIIDNPGNGKDFKFFSKKYDEQSENAYKHFNGIDEKEAINKWKEEHKNASEQELLNYAFNIKYKDKKIVNSLYCPDCYLMFPIKYPNSQGIYDYEYHRKLFDNKSFMFLYVNAGRCENFINFEMKKNYCETLVLWNAMLDANLRFHLPKILENTNEEMILQKTLAESSLKLIKQKRPDYFS